jgi:transposase
MTLLKKLQKKLKQENRDVLFFDESRFGTHSKIGHGWFLKGERTAVKVKLGFKSFYIYGAVSSKTGYNFNLLLPEVNTFGMNIFLERLAKSLKGKKVILVLDGASWHKSVELRVPVNIELMCLPPYSPELNPVEKLWQFIKSKVLKNKIYNTLDDLEAAVCDFIKNISNEEIMSNCACSYL